MSKSTRNNNVASRTITKDGLPTEGPRVQVMASSFQGPVPPPEVLAYFEKVLPGAADRFFRLAGLHAQFRIDATMKGIAKEELIKTRGQWFGFIIAVLALGVTAYLGWLGHATAAGTVGSVTVLGLVSVFITGRAVDSGELKRGFTVDKGATLASTSQKPSQS